jgi:hypothetical protein
MEFHARCSGTVQGDPTLMITGSTPKHCAEIYTAKVDCSASDKLTKGECRHVCVAPAECFNVYRTEKGYEAKQLYEEPKEFHYKCYGMKDGDPVLFIPGASPEKCAESYMKEYDRRMRSRRGCGNWKAVYVHVDDIARKFIVYKTKNGYEVNALHDSVQLENNKGE